MLQFEHCAHDLIWNVSRETTTLQLPRGSKRWSRLAAMTSSLFTLQPCLYHFATKQNKTKNIFLFLFLFRGRRPSSKKRRPRMAFHLRPSRGTLVHNRSRNRVANVSLHAKERLHISVPLSTAQYIHIYMSLTKFPAMLT